MPSIFTTLVLRHLRRERLRSLVTLVAVALGVAIALAIDLANATAIASFASSVNVISNKVNVQVLGVGRGFDDRSILRVQEIPGVAYASPTIEDALVIGARVGDPFSGEILRVLGVDLLRPLPGDTRSGGGLPGEASAPANAPDPNDLVNRHGAFVSRRVADRYHLRVGARLQGLAGDRPVALTVSGILPAGIAGVDSSVVFVDIATAQEVFEKVGRLDRIDIIAEPARRAEVERALRAVIPPGTRAIEPQVRTNEIRRMLRSFQLNLAALSYVALLVGMYLIYNTVAISVVQRRSEVGTLRALGATRGAIFRAFLGEGALFGAAGSVLGVIFGCILAQLSVGAVSRTVDALYVASHADRVLYDPLVLARAFLIGCAFATVAAIVPAIEAARTAPAIAMRSAGYERRSRRLPLSAALAGFGLLAIALLLTRLPAVDGVPLAGYASGLCMIFGVSLCVPLEIAAASRLGMRLFAGRSAPAELAAANLGASLVRNSVAVASLMIAIAMMVSIAILIGSFRTTVVAWADETLRADLFVKPLGLQDASFDARFSPSVAKTIAALPGVAALDTFRGISLPFRGRITTLGSTDFATIEDRNNLRFIGNADPRALARTLPGADRAVVSDPFATRFGVAPGDRIDIDTPVGPVALAVAAIYNDYSSDSGMILIDSHTYRRLFHDDSINSVAIYAKPGVDLTALRSRVVRSVEPLRVDAQTTRELRRVVIAIFNRTFAITYALYVISIAIAIMGVVSTLFALVLERRREIGLLRYLGLRTREVRAMVYAEAAMVGLLGGVAGVAAGVMLSFLLIFVINRQAFGWLIELHMPYDFLVEAVAMIVVAAVVAGIYPANVAARIRTAEAVRTE